MRVKPRLQKPIFMIGCPRSGTSIAVKLFARHPLVANLSEAGTLWDPKNFFNPEASHYWTAEDVTERDRLRLHAYFEFYRQWQRKERFINKHPRNSVRIDYILNIFPDAKFIHVYRDGRAVVNSIVNQIDNIKFRQTIPFGNFCKPINWRKYLRDNPYEQASYQWREIVQNCLAQKEKLRSQYFEFSYEDLCENTKKVLSTAYDFAGLSGDSKYLSEIPDNLPNMNYKYKEQIPLDQLNIITEIQKDLLYRLGYI